jgi:hypothetical protein
MDTRDYSWDNHHELLGEVVDAAALPKRIALTAPQVVIRSESGEILLVDPHAGGTWDTWMFPYASLVMTTPEIEAALEHKGTPDSKLVRFPGQTTFKELTDTLHELRRLFAQEYSAAIQAGVNNVLPQLHAGWKGTAFYENYSLKYSKTSHSYTCYAFEYYINRVAALDLNIPHVWITPAALEAHVSAGSLLAGKTISSNVREAIPAIRALAL